ncbi:MAG: H(+)-transporting ATPase [Verrucomicrobia bacterium]|nr:MAG: H(+)-transporting ATPase [Verrucomicrobiota bacterium]
MKITKKARAEAKRLFRACLVEGRLDEERARQAVAALVEQRPRGYLPILAHFQRLVKLEVTRRTARVSTAVPLEPPLQTRLTEALTHRHGAGLYLQFAVEPDLLGGLRVQVGSTVYDGSVRARLEALKQSF